MSTRTEKVKILDVSTMNNLRSRLEKNGITTIILNSEKEVKDFINDNIPDECLVGLGDSITTCRLKIRHLLAGKGSKIFYSWDGSENYNRSLDTFDILPRPDYYLSRINAISGEGEILMKDYSKEAAANGLFPRQIYAFAGMNRYCETLDKRESIQKYTVIRHKPMNTEFTLAFLPFLDY
jgi:hypothetical protein